MRIAGCVLSALSVYSCTSNSASSEVVALDYNVHVRPILSDKCFACHGPDASKREAGLRLDTPEGAFAALKESPGRFALVAGDPEKSELWHRIRSEDPSSVMPPPESKLKLTPQEVEMLRQWIEQGAAYQPHWAFIPPTSPSIPVVKAEEWPKEPLDYFVLARMEGAGLGPNSPADSYRLLKRLSFDLTGLPPSLEMQERFLADKSPEAYERVVDELMASPHYGERMAVPWLDAARYADSHGYQDDGLRTMWPWRDWVIHAFNQNYPYDQFVTWQLAGDLIPGANKEQLLATGFNRNHKITQEGGVIDEEYRIEYVTDRTNTFGKALLGLTLECAKCHDHKYDPISQQAYYETFAFFDQVPEKGIFGTIDANFADPPNMEITQEDVEGILNFVNKQDTLPLRVMVMQDSAGMRETHILDRGLYDAKAEVVYPSTPEAIMAFDTSQFARNRLGLAQWMFSPENPLTARVFVNRVWAQFFGRGLVPSVGDFGMQGELPSHPALLDWLAVDFRENRWNVKRLVKQIVMSATYQQSAVIDADALAIDPDNRFLSHAPRNRLDAEFVRDHVLASSGLLHPAIGGPSVKPYQPDGLWKAATSGRGLLQEYFQDQGPALYRRGIYTFIKRTVPPPKMLMFDASNRDQCEVERLRTNTPLQALAMLNDP
ncbi:MAG: PSD1 and planctomycete cytochrome C domain-containing protein, partial [Bacteroidota bacterium]